MNPLLEGMNARQKEAIMQTEGPLLILAGAGSGKTRVVTHRIAYLMEELNVSPYQILAITFTNKAAREMKERATQLTPTAHDVWISTFHSMCVSILRRYITLLGYEQNFAILDDVDQLALIKKILVELNIDPKRMPPKLYAGYISDVKNRLLLPSEIKPKDGLSAHQFKEVYTMYQKTLKENNRVDFDDLLMLVAKLLEENEDVLDYYANKFKYIHVDEYQDTNFAQYKIVNLLASVHRNICVVGDADQSIYSWRGADIRNILSFEQDYPEATVIKLEQNYRSKQVILDAANDVIQNNPSQYEKNLFSDLGKGTPIIVKDSYNADGEATYAAETIKKHVAAGVGYDEIAVLYRTNSQSRLFEQVFAKTSIPYRLVGGVSYFKRKEIKDLVAFLRLVLTTSDNLSFERIVNVPSRGIGPKSLGIVEEIAETFDLSLFDAIPLASERLAGASAHKLMSFYNMINDLIFDVPKLSTTAVIDEILKRTGYLEILEAEMTIEAAGRIDNLNEFKSLIVSFEKNDLPTLIHQERPDVNVADLTTVEKLEWLLTEVGLQTDVNLEEENNLPKVTLMTIHAAKGLEFKVIFVAGFEEGVFPLFSSIGEGAEAVEEERRLAYVAITRAKEFLYLLTARSRLIHGQKQFNKPSRFLGEIDAKHLKMIGIPKPNFAKIDYPADRPKVEPKISTISLGSSTFKKGDKVHHTAFGDGVVTASDGKTVTIAFSVEHGTKRLMAGHPALSKKR